jgi:DNA (cytosine-5)-methyltransferase 1
MLQPDELKQAQGFPPDYTITGDRKKDRTAQIGNAVPVHLAQALVRHLFSNQTPSLSTFGAGITGEPEADVPDYSEVNDD